MRVSFRINGDPVAVDVEPRLHLADCLREVLSLGVDRARLVVPETEAVAPDSAAAALAGVLRGSLPFDLLLHGDSNTGAEGVAARLAGGEQCEQAFGFCCFYSQLQFLATPRCTSAATRPRRKRCTAIGRATATPRSCQLPITQ